MTTVDRSVDRVPRIERDCYRDPAIAAAELTTLFKGSWLLVAHESEIPQPGDYVTRTMGTDPVIVARGDGNRLHVLLNSCTHRGTQVCKAAFGNSATFTCGYHGWSFGVDGSLRGVPGRRTLYGPDFDLAEHGLRAAHVETCHGLVFATWNEAGPTLAEYLGDFEWYLAALLDFFPGGMEVYGGVHRVVIRGNWKIHAENFSGDGYHLRTAHRTMFDLGVMGEQAKETRGWLVTDLHGHGLRAQYLTDPDVQETVLGYPDELHDDARTKAPPDWVAFRTASTVIHGTVFPNTVFITTAPVYFGTDAQGPTAFFQVRTLQPIDAHHHEVVYFSLVPVDAPPEWKRKSYLYATRQHGSASFFEADDLENFRRIDAGLGGGAAGGAPFNFELGVGREGSEPAPWHGPGRIVAQDISEGNQRNFVRRYLDVMGERTSA